MNSIQKTFRTMAMIFGLMAALPAFGMENNTYPCDNCEQQKEKLNVLNRCCEQGIYSQHILCQECEDFIEDNWKEPIVSEIWWDCKHCSYFHHEKNKACTIQGKGSMDDTIRQATWIKANYPNRVLEDVTPETTLPQGPVNKNSSSSVTGTEEATYPCDNCHQEKSLLNKYNVWDNNTECLHIICQECDNALESWKKPTNKKALPDCQHCHYFYDQKNKKCWKTTQRNSHGSTSSTKLRASYFQKQHPIRILPDATLIQNPDNPAHIPAPLDPDTPPIPTTSITDNNNKLKWLGITCAAGVIFYGVYKAYHWWKGEEAQEKYTDEQEDQQKEEAQPAEQV